MLSWTVGYYIAIKTIFHSVFSQKVPLIIFCYVQFCLINDPGKSLFAKGHGPTQLQHLTGTLTMFQMVQKEYTFVTLIFSEGQRLNLCPVHVRQSGPLFFYKWNDRINISRNFTSRNTTEWIWFSEKFNISLGTFQVQMLNPSYEGETCFSCFCCPNYSKKRHIQPKKIGLLTHAMAPWLFFSSSWAKSR